MNMAKILKNAGIFVLCMAMCLAIALPTFAAENAAVGAVKHYYVNGETETYVEGFAKAGTYRAKAEVYNYDKENTMTAVLVTGVFNNSGVIENVVTDRKTAIANGAKVTLENEIALTTTDKTLKSYLWKSIDTLVPLEGVAPAAPANVTINTDTITNSTVDITWDAPSDKNAIAYYNVYRNGKFVGSTFAHGDVNANDNSFKDVGIEHNTEVSYTVTAVDVTGNESAQSEASAAATTDDIARLWLGAAVANGEANTQITDANYTELLESNGGAYNIDVVDVFSAEKGYNDVDTSIMARTGEYAFTNGSALGLDSLDFEIYSSRILGTLSEEYMTTLSNEKEVKVIMNYFDNRVIGAKENVGTTFVNDITTAKSPSIVFKYAMEGDSSLSGTTGFQQTDSGKWKTEVMTLPTNKLADGSAYKDVHAGRRLAFKTVNKAGVGFAQTNGVNAMFAVGSNNNTNSNYFHNVILQKMDIVPQDYVPYGAVIDFNKQADTQFVELEKDGTANLSALSTAGTTDKKKAVALYGDNDAYNKLYLGVDNGYISSGDKDIIVRVTYLDNQTDSISTERLTVVYQNANGTNSTKTISRQGSGEWKTAEFFISDAGLKNTLSNGGSVQLGTYNTEDKAWYVSRVEVIKR